MPEGVIILTAGESSTAVGILSILFGLIIGVGGLVLWLCAWDDSGLGFRITVPIVACLFIGLAIFGFTQNEPYQKIMLTDNAKFNEIVEHYNITSTDGLILTVREKAK